MTVLKTTHNTIIAGKYCGKPVYCSPNANNIYQELLNLARSGNHWARVTVEGVQSLASGRLHQNNIFVQPNHLARGGTEEFVMILPGCKVSVEKLPNDEFKILHFDADLNFSELQAAQKRAGLYRSELIEGQWDTKFQEKGKILEEKNRIVAISDRRREKVEDIAHEVADYVSDAPMSGGSLRVNADGFDLHITPGKKKIGGLMNYREAIKPTHISSLNESAYLLAKTMYDAKNIQGVSWISEFGGSAVLTQAMKILADRNVTLEKHTVFLYRPSTSPNVAVQIAHQLNLNLDRKFIHTHPLDAIGNRDQLELIANRVRAKNDTYKLKNAPWDALAYGTKLQGASTAALTIAGVSTLGISNPQALAFVTAVGTVAGLGKLGMNLAEGWTPRLHKKANKLLGKNYDVRPD
ncbi:hypothetical protein [Endozoicomonas numazuensis]|uniref:Uncharacterized protein n=1 Tax=Endozoicomonas numazuensis TaxID=1137799 RepID=A0A081N1D1_9GAMM|nr:hypothetical protein [Endozoicomonas numazuensis]KEQ12254.1 hypothetical protein GZ78_27910 [Endozoicomonas numazuensis]